MDTKTLLMRNKQDHMRQILKLCGKTEEDLKQGIEALKNWIKTQPHFPEMPSDNMLTALFIMNKFSVENTKPKLDMYYTLRSIIPEIYENKNPKLPHMQELAKIMHMAPMPKLTDEGYRVTITKYLDENADNFNPYDLFVYGFNIAEIRLQEDASLGDILVYDIHNLRMGHVLKITPVVLKKSLVVVEKVFSNKLKAIHYVNSPPFAHKLASLVKSLLKPKLANRFHVHDTADQLLEHIPRAILPRDYGGDELPLPELSELWKQKFVEYQDRFDALDKMRVNENLRPTPLVNDEILGFHGNFKKLSVD